MLIFFPARTGLTDRRSSTPPRPVPLAPPPPPNYTLERAMSECLFLKAILFLLTAYLFGLWELHRPEYPTCWMEPERLACWSLAAPTGR
ncbi:hypothetical protein [Pseudomonas aeruginosa]|uniref:hypothetical protein n=3 Tax=Pseudomonas aeruginosa TaxID=287 RepID=UPI000F543D72|nr:hypothetical protein [Pseudomonas aeruginosa]MBE2963070.1 hypothetical protein [Pseudomonas aeruginosa]MBZ5245199.1 hypothetical protein [Pseudomonas aeruginosa]MCO7706659.1 hypothetical protein [Pseudomonas aeruginosa]MCO7710177.1 hypothetical protein [Pseudomonas aeruginosa]MCO7716084.1 hypothetical protein [Pseudomonas aeruginosa]